MRESVNYVVAVRHSGGIVSHCECAAGRVVSGNDEQLAVTVNDVSTGSVREVFTDLVRLSGTDVPQLCKLFCANCEVHLLAFLRKKLSDFCFVRHCSRTFKLGCHNRACNVGIIEGFSKIPALQEPVAQCATESVT